MATTPDANKRDLLLSAALDEFAQYGGGGARIDRLAKRAGVSAGLVYSYFDGKDNLFEAVYDVIVDQVTEAVPLDADDLPEYAGRLYDASLTRPDVLRFVSWYALERGDDDKVPPSVIASMQEKIAAVEDAQRRGTVTDRLTAGQLLALALSVANMWQREGDGVRGLVPAEQRRETVVAAMRTLTAPQTPPPAPDPLRVVMRFINEVVNGADLDIVPELWSADLQWHGGSLGEHHGIGEFVASLRASVGGGFSDMHLTVHDTIVSGDKVVLRFTNSGWQTGEFMGAAPSGKHAEWLGIGIYRVADGKIAEGWFGEDALGMLTQLGVVQLG